MNDILLARLRRLFIRLPFDRNLVVDRMFLVEK